MITIICHFATPLSAIQHKEVETEEILLDNNVRHLQQATSVNEEPGSTQIQEGYYKEVQQGIPNYKQG